MTEEQKPGGEEQTPGSAILQELESLGEQLATAVKSLWESEESRKLRQDIGEGFVELGRQIDTALKSAQESEAAKEFSEQVKETVGKARESDVAGKMERGLLTGLQELNAEISKLIDSMEAREPAEAEPESDPEV
jgi:hypothetical protein